MVVSVVCFRCTKLDTDNLIGGVKYLQDAIAASLGIDDGDDERISFEYSQHIGTGRQGTLVKIEAHE